MVKFIRANINGEYYLMYHIKLEDCFFFISSTVNPISPYLKMHFIYLLKFDSKRNFHRISTKINSSTTTFILAHVLFFFNKILMQVIKLLIDLSFLILQFVFKTIFSSFPFQFDLKVSEIKMRKIVNSQKNSYVIWDLV